MASWEHGFASAFSNKKQKHTTTGFAGLAQTGLDRASGQVKQIETLKLMKAMKSNSNVKGNWAGGIFFNVSGFWVEDH